MLRTNLPRAVRHLRRRRGWRQADLAERVRTSGSTVSRLERGELRGVPLGTLERVASELGASIDLTLRWEGEQLDRLIDAGHAWLGERTATQLASDGWLTRTEVSFNHYGDRGVVDILAFDPVTRVLLVIELKTAIGDIQATLGRLDVKARLGRSIGESVGWRDVRAIVPAFVLAGTVRNRRTLATHAASFGRYAMRGRAALAWVRRPSPSVPSGLLWFANVPDSHGVGVTRGRRVRRINSGR
jgi:transcriptional regulator with XRE-family HTH domain